MTVKTIARSRIGIAALTPVVLLVAFVWHPYLPGRLPNDEAIAAAVIADPTRWGLAHVAAAVASAVVVLGFLALRSWLREAGEERWSLVGLPFVILGSVLYALLPGLEFAPLAAVVAGAATFALGMVAFAAAVVRSRIIQPRLSWLVAVALVLWAVTRFVPFAAVQFYVQSGAALLALWPVAFTLGRGRAGSPHPSTPATATASP